MATTTTSETTYRPVFRWDDDCGNSYGPVSTALDDAEADAEALQTRLAAIGMLDLGQVFIEQTVTTVTTTDIVALPKA